MRYIFLLPALAFFSFSCAPINQELLDRKHQHQLRESLALEENINELDMLEKTNKKNLSDIKKLMIDRGTLTIEDFEKLRRYREGPSIPQKEKEHLSLQLARTKQKPSNEKELSENAKAALDIQRNLYEINKNIIAYPDACEIYSLAIDEEYILALSIKYPEKRPLEDAVNFLSLRCESPMTVVEKAKLQLNDLLDKQGKELEREGLQENELALIKGQQSPQAKREAVRDKAATSIAPVGRDIPKIAVWDLEPREVKLTYAKELTSILVSEITRLGRFEVYSQDNVRALAGWNAERMKLGCTDTQCLIALGHLDVTRLISGSVGKIGNTFSISLNLFDTQKARPENAVSQFCESEDELIGIVKKAVLILFETTTHHR